MELWDIYDANRNKTGKVIDRHGKEKLKQGEYHLVVQAFIINSEGQILLAKRSKIKEKFPLMWECTGGSCTKGETSLEGMLRETKEELGIQFKETEAIFYKTIKSDEARDFKDIWLFKKDIEVKDLNFPDGEVMEAKWVTICDFENMLKNKEIVPTIDIDKNDYENCIKLNQQQAYSYISKIINIKIDRKMGTKHPKWNMIYPINYGYVPNTISGDGEEIDAYLLGVFEPVDEYTGKCIAVIHRLEEDDDKLIIVPEGVKYSKQQIKALVEFQERYFKSEIIS